MAIKFYKTNAPHGFLNNFYPSNMFIYGFWWNNVEAPYQSQKTLDLEEKKLIWKCKTPRQARDLGQKIKLRPDWELIKENIMYECVLAKFLQNDRLRAALKATLTEELIEDSPIDYYWGCGADGSGQNMLGKILMKVREVIKGE